MFINFGTILPLNADEQITSDMYAQVESIIKTYIDKGSKLDEYGISDKASPIWEYGNKIIYLVGLLSVIRQRILKDYRNCRLDTFENYKETYKLECIRKTFACFSIPFDVNALYAVYGLDTANGFEGIGFEAVALDDSIICDQTHILTIGY